VVLIYLFVFLFYFIFMLFILIKHKVPWTSDVDVAVFLGPKRSFLSIALDEVERFSNLFNNDSEIRDKLGLFFLWDAFGRLGSFQLFNFYFFLILIDLLMKFVLRTYLLHKKKFKNG
jgi:hypothetical protein